MADLVAELREWSGRLAQQAAPVVSGPGSAHAVSVDRRKPAADEVRRILSDFESATAMQSPQEIAHGAVDRLCDYNAWDAPGDYLSTAERIGTFLQEFTMIAAARLAGVVKQGGDQHG